MKEILLSKRGKNKGMTTMVDDEDYGFLNQWNWYVFKRNYTFYVARCEYSDQGKKIILMHREIMKPTNGLIPDHIDRNGLNNQKHNLRNTTYSENNKNRVYRNGFYSNNSINTHPYTGVCILVRRCKNKTYVYYRSYIKINRENIYLGCFKTEQMAAIAYNKAALELYGEFANLNIIEK